MDAESPADSKVNRSERAQGSAQQSKMALTKNESASRRPMRNAKKKEVIQRHLSAKFEPSDEQPKKNGRRPPALQGDKAINQSKYSSGLIKFLATEFDVTNVPMGPFASSLIDKVINQNSATKKKAEISASRQSSPPKPKLRGK
jgi:hypothetical protein